MTRLPRPRPAAPTRRRSRPTLDRLEDRNLLSIGGLDPSFGTGGRVATDFPVSGSAFSLVSAYQPDGKLVTASLVSNLGNGNTELLPGYDREPTWELGLSRYNPDGSPDATFGQNGQAESATPDDSQSPPTSLAFQTDGKILVAGKTLTRFNADGSPDPSFGSNGQGPGLGPIPKAAGVAVLSDGTVVVAGTAFHSGSYPGSTTIWSGFSDFGLEAFHPDGSPDLAFGTNGTVITDFATSQSVVGLLVLPGDKIVVGGTTSHDGPGELISNPAGPTASLIALARYDSNGHLDPGFGSGGKLTAQAVAGSIVGGPPVQSFPASDQSVTNLSLDSAGRIVVAGGFAPVVSLGGGNANGYPATLYPIYGSTRLFVARFNPDGGADTTIGPGGVLTTTTSPFLAEVRDANGFHGELVGALTVGLLGNGEIEAAGQMNLGTGGNFIPGTGIARFNASGAPDPTFGTGGSLSYAFDSLKSRPVAFAIRGDGGVLTTSLINNSVKTYQGADPFSLDSRNQFQIVRYAADGRPDAGFGGGAGVVVDFRGPSIDAAAAVVVQADGKVVVGGTTVAYQKSNDGGGTLTSMREFALARYNADGTLDTSFGAGGRVVTPFMAVGDNDAVLDGLVIQPDGKIVAAGSYNNGVNGGGLALVRYNPDGTLDATLGGGGVVTTPVAVSVASDWTFDSVTASGVVLQADGRIVVVGSDGLYDTVTGQTSSVPVLARYNANGILDTTFGAGNGMITPGLGRGTTVQAAGVAIQPDGRIVVGGTETVVDRVTGVTAQDFNLARYNVDGTTDTTFGGTGTVTTDFNGGLDVAAAVALQADGKIVAGGSTSAPDGSSQRFALARYNADGTIDSTFGSAGLVTTGFGSAFPFATADSFDNVTGLVIQPDGKIVAAGGAFSHSSDYSSSANDFALARYNADGRLDPGFGSQGLVTTGLDSGGTSGPGSSAAGVALQADGGIVAVGTSYDPTTNQDFAVARYQGRLPVDPATIMTQLQSIVGTLQQGGSGNSVMLQATTGTQVSSAVSAVNALTANPSQPVTIALDLGGQAITTDTKINAPAGVTVVIQNGTLVGGSPALVVTSGNVVLDHVTATNSTNAPTIVVSGGSLKVRHSTIQESTGYAQVAVLVTGGTVDLGTASDPGGNTINVNGAGELVHNASGLPVSAIDDTFTINGAPITPSSLSGVVFADFNDDGQVDFGEEGIAGVTITLNGVDFLGNAVHGTLLTDSAGAYVFQSLLPGHYTIAETQPVGYTQGVDSVGTGGGTISLDQFDLNLAASLNALNYNFGERPAATGAVQGGQTAGIGFWNNKNGQALIKALNGGTGHQLGDWLAATFPHMFGTSAGSDNAAGKSNAAIAAFFQTQFVVKDQKLGAQVLATALAVYVTDGTLDNTGVGTQYGFLVGGNGVATATYNVGANGAAFGVADGTVMTVMDLLRAADAQSVDGVLYNDNAAKRTKANNVFGAINQAGST